MSGRRGERSRGQSMVEFALVIPLFLAVVIAVAEGGYYVIASSIVNHATHEGARMGVLASTGSRGTIRTKVTDTAGPVVSLPSTDIKLQLAVAQPDGTWASPSDCDNACYQTRDTGDRLTVTTDYTHVPLFGYVFPGLSIPSDAEAELLVEGAPSP